MAKNEFDFGSTQNQFPEVGRSQIQYPLDPISGSAVLKYLEGRKVTIGGTLNLKDNDITNVGDITLDSLTADDISIAINSDVFTANGTGFVFGHASQLNVNGIGEVQILGTSEGTDSHLILANFSTGNTSNARFSFLKSATSTIGDSVLLVDNELLGEMRWMVADGTNFTTTAAKIQAEVDDASPAANQVGSAIVFYTAPGSSNDDIAEVMRLTAAGDVGIGLGAPLGQLHVEQASTSGAQPVLFLDQSDISEEFIRLIGTSTNASLTTSIVEEAAVTTATREGFLKVFVQDDGNQITDQAYFIPIFTLA